MTIWISILFSGTSALAQTPLLIGEKESLLANTGVGRLGSSGAAYYNPAGLFSIQTDRVSASGTLFQSASREISGE